MVEHGRGAKTELDGVFRALADPTRRTMIDELSRNPATVSDLARPFEMSLAAASKHLKVLERAGLVERRRQGRLHICSLRASPLADAFDWLAHYRDFWPQRLDALEAALRDHEANDGE